MCSSGQYYRNDVIALEKQQRTRTSILPRIKNFGYETLHLFSLKRVGSDAHKNIQAIDGVVRKTLFSYNRDVKS